MHTCIHHIHHSCTAPEWVDWAPQGPGHMRVRRWTMNRRPVAGKTAAEMEPSPGRSCSCICHPSPVSCVSWARRAVWMADDGAGIRCRRKQKHQKHGNDAPWESEVLRLEIQRFLRKPRCMTMLILARNCIGVDAGDSRGLECDRGHRMSS